MSIKISTFIIEYIQAFGDNFQKTIPQHWWLFWTLSTKLLFSRPCLNISLLSLYVYERVCIIQKRKVRICSVLFWIAHYRRNLFTNKCQNSNNRREISNILLKVQKSHQCWGKVFWNMSPKGWMYSSTSNINILW